MILNLNLINLSGKKTREDILLKYLESPTGKTKLSERNMQAWDEEGNVSTIIFRPNTQWAQGSFGPSPLTI